MIATHDPNTLSLSGPRPNVVCDAVAATVNYTINSHNTLWKGVQDPAPLLIIILTLHVQTGRVFESNWRVC